MLDFRINTFLTVCQYMNYTRAAEALSITQPLFHSIFISSRRIMAFVFLNFMEKKWN